MASRCHGHIIFLYFHVSSVVTDQECVLKTIKPPLFRRELQAFTLRIEFHFMVARASKKLLRFDQNSWLRLAFLHKIYTFDRAIPH